MMGHNDSDDDGDGADGDDGDDDDGDGDGEDGDDDFKLEEDQTAREIRLQLKDNFCSDENWTTKQQLRTKQLNNRWELNN